MMAMALHCYAFSCPHVCVQMFILYVKHTQFIYMGMFRNGVKSSLSPPQHTHTHTHTYTHTQMCLHTHTHTHTPTSMHTHTLSHQHTHTHNQHACTHLHIMHITIHMCLHGSHSCTQILTRVYVHTHVCVHGTHIHAYMHTHTHTYTHTQLIIHLYVGASHITALHLFNPYCGPPGSVPGVWAPAATFQRPVPGPALTRHAVCERPSKNP